MLLNLGIIQKMGVTKNPSAYAASISLRSCSGGTAKAAVSTWASL